jgi:hypothetical protein
MRAALLIMILSSAARSFVSPWQTSYSLRFHGDISIKHRDVTGKVSIFTTRSALLRIRGGSLDSAMPLQGDSGDPNRKPENEAAMEIDTGSVDFPIMNQTLLSVMIPFLL